MIDYALNRIEAELLKLAEEAKHAPIDSSAWPSSPGRLPNSGT